AEDSPRRPGSATPRTGAHAHPHNAGTGWDPTSATQLVRGFPRDVGDQFHISALVRPGLQYRPFRCLALHEPRPTAVRQLLAVSRRDRAVDPLAHHYGQLAGSL